MAGTKNRERAERGRGHIDSYQGGQQCAVLGCTTVLSRYNSNTVCAQHDESLRNDA
jgi:hypothetical protein